MSYTGVLLTYESEETKHKIKLELLAGENRENITTLLRIIKNEQILINVSTHDILTKEDISNLRY